LDGLKGAEKGFATFSTWLHHRSHAINARSTRGRTRLRLRFIILVPSSLATARSGSRTTPSRSNNRCEHRTTCDTRASAFLLLRMPQRRETDEADDYVVGAVVVVAAVAAVDDDEGLLEEES
jgi:hypothetical protein